MILTLSLNLVNGYMGEFSVATPGLWASAPTWPRCSPWQCCPRPGRLWPSPGPGVRRGGGGAAGLIVAYPSFRTRGDYLAIVTLAFNMIVKSVLENIPSLGAPGAIWACPGSPRCSGCAWVILTLLILRNLVFSNFGRGSRPSGKTKWPPT